MAIRVREPIRNLRHAVLVLAKRRTRLAVRERDNEAKSGVRWREAADFVVGEAGGFSGLDYVDLANFLAALWINNPDSAIL